MVRNSTMANEFTNLLDDVVKSFLSKQDIDSLKARKLDDVERYGRRKSLRLNGFHTTTSESSKNCAKMVKEFENLKDEN